MHGARNRVGKGLSYRLARAGIFKKSMGARHRGGIGFSYRHARLHRLAEFIHRHQFLGSLNVYKYGLWSLISIIQHDENKDDLKLFCAMPRCSQFLWKWPLGRGRGVRLWHLLCVHYQQVRHKEWITIMNRTSWWRLCLNCATRHDLQKMQREHGTPPFPSVSLSSCSVESIILVY